VQGLGTICPECGLLVTVGQDAAAAMDPISAAEQTIEPRPLPAEFVPATEDTAPKEPPYTLYFIIGGLAALVIVLAATLIILLTRPAIPPPVVIATPPTRSAPVKPAEPKGSDWFNENPQSPSAEAPAPTTAATTELAVAPPPAPPATTQAAPPPPHLALTRIRPRPPVPMQQKVTDEQVGEAMEKGLKYLKAQFVRTRLGNAERVDPETFQGLNALAIYALLHAGQAVNDTELTPQSDMVKELLDRLKELPMNGNKATYSRSLRISALGVYNRPEDRDTIRSDLDWLRRSSMQGAYTYSMPPENRSRTSNTWDNSNSQYGALGVWAAAEAGFASTADYWREVEQHWIASQTITGGWGYAPNSTSPTLSMTAAGATMLFVARDQQLAVTTANSPFVPLSKQILGALEWLDEGDHAIKPEAHRGYTLYGLERAGLASGYKYFGVHDWYAELARRAVSEQQPNGTWAGADGEVAETSFTLLFLARGRAPVLISKLSFDGNWANRPRDVASLSRYASYQLERPVNWEIGDIRRAWYEWSDAPVLFITSDKAPVLKDSEVEKLRDFAEWGGTLFLHAERGSPEFNAFAADLAARAFPQYRYETLPQSHPLYSSMTPLTFRPELRGVSNGSRLLLVHCPRDIAGAWQVRPPRNQRAASDLALNIAIYATGRMDLRNRLSSPFVPPPLDEPVGVVPMARLKYQGNWDPEPHAWDRAARIMQYQTGVQLRPVPTALDELNYEDFPIAHLTGTQAPQISDLGAESLRSFVNKGGLLIIDSCGGSQAFADAVSQQLLPRLFPGAVPEPLTADSSLINSALPGMKDLSKPLLRAETPRDQPLMMLQFGQGTVVFSPLDISTGLLSATPVGIRGYRPGYAQDLAQNMVFWALNHIAGRRATTSNP
jgi:hypothetical protein